MTDEQVNARLSELDEDGPYRLAMGWYWRDVDFDRPLPLHRFPEKRPPMVHPIQALLEPEFPSGTVRICVRDKWGYPRVEATPEQDAAIKSALRRYAETGTSEDGKAAWDAMQVVTNVVDEGW